MTIKLIFLTGVACVFVVRHANNPLVIRLGLSGAFGCLMVSLLHWVAS